MPEGWFSFLFHGRNKEESLREQPPNTVTNETNILSVVEKNVETCTSPENHLTAPTGSVSPSYGGGIQSPSPPPSTTNLSASPPLSHDVIPEHISKPSSRPISVRKSAPLSCGSRKRVVLEDSPTSPNRSRNSPFKLPPSPASLSSGLPIPPATIDFEARAVQELKTLLKNVPAKTLHNYLASRLNKLAPSELISLSQLLSELEPPPLLHCVRCHSDFTDVENTNHSCTVPHDDDSAVVQYSRGGSKPGMGGHETFWGCCGQTVEGEGELGPPSGWCYEGKHTVDVKRARWRGDSTIHDDKLISCNAKGCFRDPEPPRPKRQTRGRGRKRTRGKDNEDDLDDLEHQSIRSRQQNASLSPSAVSVRSTRSTKRRPSPAISIRSTTSRGQRKNRDPPPTNSIEFSPQLPPVPSILASQPISKARPRTKSKANAPVSTLLESPEVVTPISISNPKKGKASSMRPRSRSVVSATSTRVAGITSAVAAINAAAGGACSNVSKNSRKRALADAYEGVSVASVQVSDSEVEREREQEKKAKKSKKRRVS